MFVWAERGCLAKTKLLPFETGSAGHASDIEGTNASYPGNTHGKWVPEERGGHIWRSCVKRVRIPLIEKYFNVFEKLIENKFELIEVLPQPEVNQIYTKKWGFT